MDYAHWVETSFKSWLMVCYFGFKEELFWVGIRSIQTYQGYVHFGARTDAWAGWTFAKVVSSVMWVADFF